MIAGADEHVSAENLRPVGVVETVAVDLVSLLALGTEVHDRLCDSAKLLTTVAVHEVATELSRAACDDVTAIGETGFVGTALTLSGNAAIAIPYGARRALVALRNTGRSVPSVAIHALGIAVVVHAACAIEVLTLWALGRGIRHAAVAVPILIRGTLLCSAADARGAIPGITADALRIAIVDDAAAAIPVIAGLAILHSWVDRAGRNGFVFLSAACSGDENGGYEKQPVEMFHMRKLRRPYSGIRARKTRLKRPC